jgi:hypothetical protein
VPDPPPARLIGVIHTLSRMTGKHLAAFFLCSRTSSGPMQGALRRGFWSVSGIGRPAENSLLLHFSYTFYEWIQVVMG